MNQSRISTKIAESSAGLDRRRFLSLAATAAALSSVGIAGAKAGDRMLAALTGDSTAAQALGSSSDQILVSIQLEGGLDFLDTVIPFDDTRYQRLRSRSGVELDRVHDLDGEFGLHPNLSHLASRWRAGELGIVHGVGVTEPSLSHFVDSAVWERGRTTDIADGGWLARALRTAGGREADPLLGISIGSLSPTMASPDWNAVALPEDGRLPWTKEFIQEFPTLVHASGQTVAASAAGLTGQVRAAQRLVRDVADTVGGATNLAALAETVELLESEGSDSSVDDEIEGGLLTHRLRIVADLITAGMPTRAYHVRFGGFDTHSNQQANLPLLLSELNSALAQFDAALGNRRRDVVIATWTEFGRRPDWNGSGTDHGTAGTHFVLGPSVSGGHHGQPVDLSRFDSDDNFVVTSDFRTYLGSLASEIIGVDPERILQPPATMELLK